MLLSTICISACLLLLYRIASNFFTPGLSAIPGPILARSSNLWRFIDACRGQHPQTIVQCHLQYGPVVRIGPNVVSVSDPAAIELILGLKSNYDKTNFVKPMMIPYEGEQLPMLISAIDLKYHSQLKRPIAGLYSMTTMLKFEGVIDENINKLVQRWKEAFTKPQSQACSISDWMSYFSFNFILQATFSKNFGFLDTGSDVDDMIWMLNLQGLYIATVGVMPWVDYLLLKNPILLAIFSTPNKLVDFASEQVRSRAVAAQMGKGTREQDFLSLFRAAQHQHQEIVSDLHVTTYAATNVLAASDTTSAALAAILYYVLKHPPVLEKLRDELDGIDTDGAISYHEASRLEYLDAVIKEVLRLHPPSGVDLERMVGTVGLVLPGGYQLPHGTNVCMNPWAVHRDRSVFGYNADSFEPERWFRRVAEPVEAFEERLRIMQRSMIAFGAGPRACLGKHMAILQLYKVVPTLLKHFDMERIDSDRPLKTWTGLSVKLLDFQVKMKQRKLSE